MEKNKKFMRKAIALSIENVKNGGGPFGAVIVKDGKIIATGVNRVTANNDPTAAYRDWETDRKSTRLNSSHITRSRMPSSA